MRTISNLAIQSGSIQYEKGDEGRPATEETTGNVTIKNLAIPPTPAHYIVNFDIAYDTDEGGIKKNAGVSFTCSILSDDDEASYREIESEAANKIAPYLRSLADAIESEITAFEGRRLKKKGSGAREE